MARQSVRNFNLPVWPRHPPLSGHTLPCAAPSAKPKENLESRPPPTSQHTQVRWPTMAILSSVAAAYFLCSTLICHVTEARFRRQPTSKPSIHNSSSYGVRKFSAVWEKTTDGWTYSGWKVNVCKMKGLIVRPVVWEHLCGIWKVPIVPNGVPGGKEEAGVRVPPLATLSLM
jgi:hypothetical protein